MGVILVIEDAPTFSGAKKCRPTALASGAEVEIIVPDPVSIDHVSAHLADDSTQHCRRSPINAPYLAQMDKFVAQI